MTEGEPWPLGPTRLPGGGGCNFALYSRHATAVTLLLYAADDPAAPLSEFRLDPIRNKTGLTWHCRVPEAQLSGAAHYAYRVDGPRDRAAGHRFDPGKVLLDPFAPSVHFPRGYSRQAAAGPGPTDGVAPLGVLPGEPGGRAPDLGPRPRHGHDLVVCELHVRGFTARANSGVSAGKRGTFAGLVEKIPYLVDLGVTAVELLPVHQFDPQEGNYWGYMTLNFFSPHRGYAGADPAAEFRAMVSAFHAAGIEVWLDVVYNHTDEGDDAGPTHGCRGIDNRSYYLTLPGGGYRNDTGCGNTLACAQPAVRSLVLASLNHWAGRMGVDGFRFDLASIFARAADGSVNAEDPPLVAEVSLLGYLRGVRLVAEAWDIGSYLLGRSFPGLAWRQWNGKFRDDARAFVKGDAGMLGAMMRRLYGSDDLFPEGPAEVYRPQQSVNLLTAHDGFCLYDLTAYDRKHNEANGHGNTDGTDDNRSWNCGWEGDDGAPPAVLALRRRQVRNFFCLLMLANGTPMFCAGDEFLNTQQGNNNPYNQDNETTWLDWDLLEGNRDVHRFFRLMIAFRKAHPAIGGGRFWREAVRWHGAAGPVDFSPESRSFAWFLRGSGVGDADLYTMVNAHWEARAFTVQEGRPGEWRRVVDTGRPSPEDIAEPGAGAPLAGAQVTVGPRSIVVLERGRAGG